YFHQATAACENNLRHLHCRKHNNQPDDNIKEPEDFPIIVRRNSFKANTPHHANNDNDINKQHGGGDIFAGVQRLTKDVVKRRQTKPDAQRNHQLFEVKLVNVKQQQNRQEGDDSDREAFTELGNLNVDQQVDQRQQQITTDSDRTRHTPPASVVHCTLCGYGCGTIPGPCQKQPARYRPSTTAPAAAIG